MKKWRQYERLVALLLAEEQSSDLTVIPNTRIKGFISERKRQIDVLVEFRYDSVLNRRIIFDAKYRKRPIDIKQVESFEGLMKDVKAQRGYIVCSNGYTKSALKRAQQHIGIRLLKKEELDDFCLDNWDNCLSGCCSDGLVLWDIYFGIFETSVTAQAAGKCDVCGKFHIWCWGCGNRKCIEFESEFQCFCKGNWFWLTSIEPEYDENIFLYNSHYLLLIMANGNYEIIDRRPI